MSCRHLPRHTKWQASHNRWIYICELDDGHLLNIISFLRKKYRDLKKRRDNVLSILLELPFQSKVIKKITELLDVDEDRVIGMERPEYYALLEEARVRGLNV